MTQHEPRWRRRVSRLASKVLTTFYRRVIVLTCPLDEHISPRHARLEVAIRILEPGEIDAYLRLRPDQREAEIRSRLAKGDRCIGGWHREELVDTSWLATGVGRLPYLRAMPRLDASDICCYDTYTAPAFRGRGLYMATNYWITRLARAEGFDRSVAFVAAENAAPLLLLRRWGYRAIGIYHCVRLGPWQTVWQHPYGAEALPDIAA